jgi:hypothetical protein
LRRSISRGSIHRTSQARALSTRVSESTLCLLGQSNKAIGHESQIGPCVATHPVDNHQACCFRNDWRRHDSEMEPQGRGSVSPLRTRRRNTALGLRKTTLGVGVHVQTVGLNAETNGPASSRRGDFSLDIPFYRTCPVSALIRSYATGRPSSACECLQGRLPRTPFAGPKLLQPHVLDADYASNETEPAHRLATFQSQTRVSDTWY